MVNSKDIILNFNLSNPNDNQSKFIKPIARQFSLNTTSIQLHRSYSNSFNSFKQPEIKAYKKRWLMITISLLLCITNSYQWIQFSSITDKLTLFYGISNQHINLLSIIYFLIYFTCIIPATKLIERKGLRYSIVLGALLNFTGSLIKCASIDQTYGFFVALLGQVFAGAACLLVFNVPPEIACSWFKSEEVSRVISLVVCSCFLGNSIAFFLPTLMLGNLIKITEIQLGLSKLYFGTMLVTGFIFILTFIFFEEKPPVPPSLSQYYRLVSAKPLDSNETTSLKDLFKNKNLVTFVIYSSINAGVFDAFATLLNQMILIEFPGDIQKVSSIGILFIFSGMLGSLICGYLLDKMHKYKEISIFFYGLSLLFLILFMFKLHFSSSNFIYTKNEFDEDQFFSNNVLLHIYIFGLGFFLIGYWTIRFDFGTELAYPSSASTVCGLTAACCDLFGILITLISSNIMDRYGTLASNLSLVCLLAIGLNMLCMMKPDYKRQKANKVKKPLVNQNSKKRNFNRYGSLDTNYKKNEINKSLISSPIISSNYSKRCFKFSSSHLNITS